MLSFWNSGASQSPPDGANPAPGSPTSSHRGSSFSSNVVQPSPGRTARTGSVHPPQPGSPGVYSSAADAAGPGWGGSSPPPSPSLGRAAAAHPRSAAAVPPATTPPLLPPPPVLPPVVSLADAALAHRRGEVPRPSVAMKPEAR